jgi:hypothetical protein
MKMWLTISHRKYGQSKVFSTDRSKSNFILHGREITGRSWKRAFLSSESKHMLSASHKTKEEYLQEKEAKKLRQK